VRRDWDAAKAAANLTKHGVAFETVARFRWDTAFEVEDARYDYGERRWRVIGEIDGRLHVLVYADRGEALRLISLRKADEREARLHARFRSS
jgi:hypothetical protein